MSNGLKDWLDVELNKLGWSYRELAKRIGVSQSVLLRVLSGQKQRVSPDFYKNIVQTRRYTSGGKID